MSRLLENIQWREGTQSVAAPNHRWHCLCTAKDDAQAWGLHKTECWRCYTESPFIAQMRRDAKGEADAK